MPQKKHPSSAVGPSPPSRLADVGGPPPAKLGQAPVRVAVGPLPGCPPFFSSPPRWVWRLRGGARPIYEVWRRGAAAVHGGLLAAASVVMVAQTRGGVDAVGRG